MLNDFIQLFLGGAYHEFVPDTFSDRLCGLIVSLYVLLRVQQSLELLFLAVCQYLHYSRCLQGR